MHNNENINQRKSFVLKLCVFIIVIAFIGISYLESKNLFDIFSLIMTIILLIKFLIVKLYH